MSFEPVDFYLKDNTPGQLPLANAVVKILSANGLLVYGQEATDVNGRASFLLPSEFSYQARFYLFGVSFAQPQVFQPTADTLNVFDVEGQRLIPPVPTDVRICTAYGFFRNVSGAPHIGADVHFIAKFNPVWMDGSAVVSARVIAQTDERGYIQVNLFRNAKYDCMVDGETGVFREVWIPDAPNVNIADLLLSVVTRVVAVPPGPYAINVGDELEVSLNIFTSDGRDLGMAQGDVRFRASDSSILSFRLSTTQIILQGIAAGSASIAIERADASVVHIPDPGVLGQPLAAVVT